MHNQLNQTVSLDPNHHNCFQFGVIQRADRFQMKFYFAPMLQLKLAFTLNKHFVSHKKTPKHSENHNPENSISPNPSPLLSQKVYLNLLKNLVLTVTMLQLNLKGQPRSTSREPKSRQLMILSAMLIFCCIPEKCMAKAPISCQNHEIIMLNLSKVVFVFINVLILFESLLIC